MSWRLDTNVVSGLAGSSCSRVQRGGARYALSDEIVRRAGARGIQGTAAG